MGLNLATDWQYQHGRPDTLAVFKHHAEDFIVREILGYELTGEGEHIYVWLQKQNLNTAYVAEQLAAFCKVPLRAVSYAGRKDKFAKTEQWFGIHLPGKMDIDWSSFQLEGANVMRSLRHNKKLRTGQLKGNQFEIRLRNVSDLAECETRLLAIQQNGVPNYYGEQRFGVRRNAEGELQVGGNLQLAERMVNGENIRNRNKRSMAISALRSWLFNWIVSERLKANMDRSIMPGDALKLSGSNSFFIAEASDPSLEERFEQRDIGLTAPLWGSGELASQESARAFEQDSIKPYQAITSTLASLGLKQERRALRVYPEKMVWHFEGNDALLQFELPSGCFATAIIRELAITEQE